MTTSVSFLSFYLLLGLRLVNLIAIQLICWLVLTNFIQSVDYEVMLSQKKNDVTVDVDSKDSSSKHDALLLFGINMGILPRSFQLIFCIFMIFLLFVLYGYCQVSKISFLCQMFIFFHHRKIFASYA